MNTSLATDTSLSPTKKRRFFSRLPLTEPTIIIYHQFLFISFPFIHSFISFPSIHLNKKKPIKIKPHPSTASPPALPHSAHFSPQPYSPIRSSLEYYYSSPLLLPPFDPHIPSPRTPPRTYLQLPSSRLRCGLARGLGLVGGL